MTLARLISIQSPLLSLNWAAQRRRARLMVVTAWTLAIIFSSPQAVIFRCDVWMCVNIYIRASIQHSIKSGF